MKVKDTQPKIEAALATVMRSGQFRVTRIQPPIGVCRTCWGTEAAASGVDGGSYVPCPSCSPSA